MNKSLKAALLSGFLFPGAGQLWLKLYIRGIVLILAVSASLAVLMTKAAKQAIAVLEKVESEGGAVDIVAILRSASDPTAISDDMVLASLILVLCWVVGMVDAYIMGRKKDLADRSKDQGI